MSYTTMYKVAKSGDVKSHREYRNAFRSAWLVWDTMSKLYHVQGATQFMLENNMQPVWDLWKSTTIPEDHRIVMASTFDRVMVRKENLERLAIAYENYASDVGLEDAGHLPAMARDLRALAQDDDCLAVCWQQTSVSEDLWSVPIRCETCGQETDDWRPYNINLDKDHWFLFDSYE